MVGDWDLLLTREKDNLMWLGSLKTTELTAVGLHLVP